MPAVCAECLADAGFAYLADGRNGSALVKPIKISCHWVSVWFYNRQGRRVLWDKFRFSGQKRLLVRFALISNPGALYGQFSSRPRIRRVGLLADSEMDRECLHGQAAHGTAGTPILRLCRGEDCSSCRGRLGRNLGTNWDLMGVRQQRVVLSPFGHVYTPHSPTLVLFCRTYPG